MSALHRAMALLTAIAAVGCGSGGETSAVGGMAALSIGGAAGSNVATNIPPISVVLGYGGLLVGALSYEHQPTVDVKRWQLTIGFSSAPAAGQTFTVGPRQPAGAGMMAAMEIQELPVGGGRIWEGASGTIAVPTRVGDQVTLAFENVPFQPAQGGSGNQAMGMFTLTGRITVGNINQPLPTE